MQPVYLHRIDPPANMRRFYTLEVCPTLWGRWALIRYWGRIGSSGQWRETWYDSESAACAAGELILRKKLRRGYVCMHANVAYFEK
jgi:predicted DNA-binding WGR domain protein